MWYVIYAATSWRNLSVSICRMRESGLLVIRLAHAHCSVITEDHVGLFETSRYKRTGQFFFIWNYIGNWYVFSKYLDNYCRYQYCANDTLFRNISSILRSIFQDILPKKRCRLLRDNRHCPFLYKTDSKFFGNQCVYRCLKWSH